MCVFYSQLSILGIIKAKDCIAGDKMSCGGHSTWMTFKMFCTGPETVKSVCNLGISTYCDIHRTCMYLCEIQTLCMYEKAT